MKYILLFFIFSLTLFAGVIKTRIVTLDSANQIATIKVNKVDVGVSGFVTHRHSKTNASILKNVEVIAYDAKTRIATLQMSDFDQLRQNSLPSAGWNVEVGDLVILAFGYSRALLIAPNEEVYYKIIRAANKIQWVHPDVFTTILSFNGHPTPLKEDFNKMNFATSVGLVFFYINKKLFTVDAKSLKVLNISDAPLKQESVKLPFYNRIDTIDSNWWGEGSNELSAYEPYYCGLLIENNPHKKEIQKICSMKASKSSKGGSSWSITNIYNTLIPW